MYNRIYCTSLSSSSWSSLIYILLLLILSSSTNTLWCVVCDKNDDGDGGDGNNNNVPPHPNNVHNTKCAPLANSSSIKQLIQFLTLLCTLQLRSPIPSKILYIAPSMQLLPTSSSTVSRINHISVTRLPLHQTLITTNSSCITSDRDRRINANYYHHHTLRNVTHGLGSDELHSLPVLTGRLLILECSLLSAIWNITSGGTTTTRSTTTTTTTINYGLSIDQCINVLTQISKHNLVDHVVMRRLFTLLVVYRKPFASKTNKNSDDDELNKLYHFLLHSPLAMKIHATIVVYEVTMTIVQQRKGKSRKYRQSSSSSFSYRYELPVYYYYKLLHRKSYRHQQQHQYRFQPSKPSSSSNSVYNYLQLCTSDTQQQQQPQHRLSLKQVNYIRPLENACLTMRMMNQPQSTQSFSNTGQSSPSSSSSSSSLIKRITTKMINIDEMIRYMLAFDIKTNHPLPCNLHHQTLKVVITQSFFCEFFTNKDGDITLQPSVEFDALMYLSNRYNFTYRVLNANGSYGRKESNVWLGSIGYVVNRTADIAMCDLIYTYDRGKVVDFTFPLNIEPVSFLTKQPGFRVRKWAFFLSLPWTIWLATLICFLILGAVLHYMFALQYKHLYMRWKLMTLASTTVSYTSKTLLLSSSTSLSLLPSPPSSPPKPMSAYMLMTSIFLQQSFNQQEQNILHTPSVRTIVLVWCIGAFVIMRCYSGIFYSTITVPEQLPAIDTVDEVQDVAMQDTGYVFTSRYLYDMAMAASCCGTFDYELGQHVRRNPMLSTKQDTNFEYRITALEEYRWDQWKPLIFITSRSILYIYSRYIPYALHISSATFLLDALGIACQKDALYVPFFTDSIMQLIETGQVVKWFRDTLLRHEHRATERRKLHARQPKHSTHSFQFSDTPSSSESSSSSSGSSSSSTSYAGGVVMMNSDTVSHMERENFHNFRLDELESVFFLYLCGNAIAGVIFLIQLLYLTQRPNDGDRKARQKRHKINIK